MWFSNLILRISAIVIARKFYREESDRGVIALNRNSQCESERDSIYVILSVRHRVI